MSPKTFVAGLGIVATLLGLLLLFLPMSASVNGNSIGCGSAAVESDHDVQASVLSTSLTAAARGDQIAPIGEARAACAATRSARGALSWSLIGAGAVVAAGARFVRWTR